MACPSLQYPPPFQCTSIIISPRHSRIHLPTHPTYRLVCRVRFCLDLLLFWANSRMSVNLVPSEEAPSNRNIVLYHQSPTCESMTLEKARTLGCRRCINGMWLPPEVLNPSSRGGRIGIRRSEERRVGKECR